MVDPAWRTSGENAVLVVGGTAEPVLHAPASPWFTVHDDGRVTMRAALRRGAGERLAVHVDDEVLPMRVVGGDATHRRHNCYRRQPDGGAPRVCLADETPAAGGRQADRNGPAQDRAGQVGTNQG
jgi:hypothetical protein